MKVCVFSFNRGTFLENCIESIERCAPNWTICILDDNSDDPETRAVLERLGSTHQVIYSEEKAGRKHGGLYANMQLAYKHFSDEALLLFTQDDMQMVRPVSEFDEVEIKKLFDSDGSIAFVQPCFLKGSSRNKDHQTLIFEKELNCYSRIGNSQSAGVHYSDVAILSPGRLLSKNWRFFDSEPKNDLQAIKYFRRMPYLFCPFMMWLPEVPAYRGKRKTLALKIAERRRPCGLHPYRDVNPDQLEEFRFRNPEKLPVAEDFLINLSQSINQPWSYYPLQDSRILKKLNSLELSVRRFLGLL